MGRHFCALWTSTLALAGCAVMPEELEPVGVAVVANPYAGVNWSTDARLKVQLHDHAGVDTAMIRAYDQAGYGAMSLMTYSGLDTTNFSWRERRWPVDQWLSPGFLASLESITVWFPNGEEAGFGHLTSPFLGTYIRRATRANPIGYTSTQTAVDEIASGGGLPIIAHPWSGGESILSLRGFWGVEIYTAFAEYRRLVTRDPTFVSADRNGMMLAVWDELLRRNPAMRGVAVNDHFGPGSRTPDLPDHIRDSGKILVFASRSDLVALRGALMAGQFLAIRDWSTSRSKGSIPRLDSLIVTEDEITLVSDALSIQWIGNGGVIGVGSRLDLRTIPSSIGYVRAELADSLGTVVYTQAFALQPARP